MREAWYVCVFVFVYGVLRRIEGRRGSISSMVKGRDWQIMSGGFPDNAKDQMRRAG